MYFVGPESYKNACAETKEATILNGGDLRFGLGFALVGVRSRPRLTSGMLGERVADLF